MPYTEDRHEPLENHKKSRNNDSECKKYHLQRTKGNGVEGTYRKFPNRWKDIAVRKLTVFKLQLSSAKYWNWLHNFPKQTSYIFFLKVSSNEVQQLPTGMGSIGVFGAAVVWGSKTELHKRTERTFDKSFLFKHPEVKKRRKRPCYCLWPAGSIVAICFLVMFTFAYFSSGFCQLLKLWIRWYKLFESYCGCIKQPTEDKRMVCFKTSSSTPL